MIGEENGGTTPERVTLGRMQNPVRGFLHGSAALLAVVGTVFLLMRATTVGSRIAVVVFGLGMVALYTTSSLYHSIPWGLLWKKRMQRLDHTMIYVLIAATYTPIVLIALDGWLRVAALAIAWGITLIGAFQQAFFPTDKNTFSVAMTTTLGWLALFFMWPLAVRVGGASVALLAAGGVLYTVGMVFLVTNRPRLWPRVFSYHEVFHVLVVAATILHFLTIYRDVVPLAV